MHAEWRLVILIGRFAGELRVTFKKIAESSA